MSDPKKKEQDPAPEGDDKNAKLKQQAREKAQGMVDYMFGKKKDKEGGDDKTIGQEIEEDPFEMDFMKDFIDVVPQKVQFEDIPKIHESKRDWHQGIRKIEN